MANYYYAISVWKREKESENPAGFKQAEALLEHAVAIDPRLEDAYLQLGILHLARGDSEQAIRDCQKAFEVNPHLSEAHRQLGLAYQRIGQKSKANRNFTYKEEK